MHDNIERFVYHRAESKVGYVDALSRHVGTVIKGGNSDKENVPRERAKNASYAKQTQGSRLNNREFFPNYDVFLKAKTKDNPQVHRKHKVQLKVSL